MTIELTPREKKLLAKRGYETLPICQLEGCDQPVKIGKANGFYLCVGCCPEHIRKINAKRSGESQIGKTRSKMTGLSLEQSQKLKEKGYIVIDETFSKGYKIKVQCPSCQTVFSRSVHNALSLCAPLCKKCADKKRGDETSTPFAVYQQKIEENSSSTIISSFEQIQQHQKIQIKCSCGSVFKRMGQTLLNGAFHCLECGLNSSTSKIEMELREFILSLGVKVKWTARSWSNNKFEIDVFCPEQMIGFEMNGMFWHSDTHKLKTYHKEKTDLAREKGIHLITIFEDEWIFKNLLVKNKIRSILGVSEQPQIQARKCQVVDVSSSKEQRSFQEMTHIQGFKPASRCRGLIFEDQLVALLSIQGNKIERFCSSNPITGGFQKLLASFKFEPGTQIETFCDLRWSNLNNNVYSRSGFVLDHLTQPGFFYYKNGKRFSRLKFQKHKLKDLLPSFDPTKTADQNMRDAGFLVVWDCGHAQFKRVL